MSGHTHLSGIQVDGDKINFSFAQHEDQPIAGLEIPEAHDTARLAAQLQQMAKLGLLSDQQVQAVTGQPGMEQLAELYKPQPKEPSQTVPPAVSADGIMGAHTADYLAQQAAANQKQGGHAM